MIRWYSQPPNGVTTSSIRVVNIEDAPWFSAIDVCSVLGFKKREGQGYNRNISMLDKEERGTVKKGTHHGCVALFEGTSSTVSVISESGLYKLVLRSNLPEAKGFQDWVTKVVLPAIRKDGGYVLGEEKVVTGEMTEDELVLKVMQMQVAGLYLPQIFQGSHLSLPLEPTPVCPFRMPMVGRGSSRGFPCVILRELWSAEGRAGLPPFSIVGVLSSVKDSHY